MMTKKPSLKDIARKAGVSVTLASYVLNDQQLNRINKLTAQRIREAAKNLNYRSNQAAKSLKTNRTFTIGLVIADISNPFFSGLARIIEDEAAKLKYTVLFGSSDENKDKFSRLIDTFLNRQVDGLIIAPPQNAESEIEYLQQQQTPFVLIDRYFPEVKTDYVILDNFGSAYHAVEHLIKGGGQRIGLICYQTELCHLTDRKKGYLAALKNHHIKFQKNLIREVGMNNNREEIEKAVKDLLNPKIRIDSLLLTSNIIANYAVKYINTLPVKVPGNLSIVCFDETESLDLFYAPLTYIKQPLEEMGRTAIKILMDKLSIKSKISEVNLQGELIVRKSTKIQE